MATTSDLLGTRAIRARVPQVVTLIVTDRCNYSCTHCYQEHDVQPDELTFDEIRRILGEVAAAGTLFLVLQGGEFFMRRDADEILALAHELGFAIRLKTTGHHVHDARADFLATLRPPEVDLSLYSASAHVHEQVTRQEGSWERTVAAARRLTARGVPVVLRAPLMQVNADSIEGVTQLAAEIGCNRSFDPKIISRHGGDMEPVSLRMDAESVRAFYAQHGDELGRPYIGYEPATRSIDGHELRPVDHAPCGAGLKGVSITPEGKVWPCSTLAVPIGNLRTHSFREIWHGSPDVEAFRTLTWAHISECNSCELRPFCTRCHASALQEQGDMFGPSLEACRHAVAIRDELRTRGIVPADHTVMPPTWDRVDPDGQHRHPSKAPVVNDGKRRPSALRVLP